MGISSLTGNKRRFMETLRAQAAVIVPAIMLNVGGFALAWQFVEPAAPTRLVMATGSKTGAYHAFGREYADYFVACGVTLELQNSAGSVENLKTCNRKSAPMWPSCKAGSAMRLQRPASKRLAVSIINRSGFLSGVMTRPAA